MAFKINPPFNKELISLSIFERDMEGDPVYARTIRNGAIIMNEDNDEAQKVNTLSHEIIHKRQFLDEARKPGTGLDYDEKYAYYKGKKYSLKRMEKSHPSEPWEKPAYKNEIKTV